MVRAHRVPVPLNGLGLEVRADQVLLSYAADDRITRSVYDKDGRLSFLVEGSSLTEYRYDDVGNAIRTIRYGWAVSPASTYTFDDLLAQVEAHDAVGDPKRVERSAYDMTGRVVFTIDGAGAVTRFSYDSGGRVIKQTAFATLYLDGGDAGEGTLQIWADGNPHADDRISRAIYDRKGRLAYSVDAKGFVTEYRYTRTGEVTAQIRHRDSYVISDSDTPETIDDMLPGLSNTVITNFYYDSAGRLDGIQDAEGNRTAMVLDDLGQALSTTVTAWGTWETSTTLRSYDALGRTETETRAHGTTEQVTTRYHYDTLGRLDSITYADGTADACTTTRVYDELGRLESETRADGHPEEVTTAYTYTTFGDVETIAYAAGTTDESVTVRYYDVHGRIEHEMKGYWGGPLTNTVYTYNAFGEVQTVAEGAYLPEESVTARTYDGRGNLETETRAAGTADATTTRFGYNEFGELETVTSAFGTTDAAVETRFYDALGRVVTIARQVDGQPSNDLVTTQEYDGFGNLVKVTDPRLNSIHYYYDKLGRVELQIDQEGYATETTYHALHGEPETVTRYWTELSPPFDVNQRPTMPTDARDATTRFEYDALGQLIQVTDAEDHSEYYDLDIHGNRIKLTNKLGGETDYTYDKLGRMKTQFVHGDVYNSEDVLQATGVLTEFEYDKRGNLKSKTEGANLVWWEARTITYKYDQLDRLIEIDREDLSSLKSLTVTINLQMKDTFRYDMRGNLIEENIAGRPVSNFYYYDKLGRRTLEIGPTGRMSEWEYDANGNVLSHRIYGDLVDRPEVPWAAPPDPIDPNNFRETRFTYDKANRLQTTRGPELTTGRWNGTAWVFESGEIVQELDYDAAGNVIRQGVGDVETRSFFDKANRKIGQLDAEGYLTVWERDGEGNVVKETRYAERVTAPIGANPDVAALHAAAAPNPHGDDRVTEFGYDRNGRRRFEMRRDVEAWTVTGSGGVLGQDNAPGHVHSRIEYEYNGFGQVVRRIEANGDDTSYQYDEQGRLDQTIGETFLDHNGVAVAPTTEHRYDGFGAIVRTVENPASANARVTRYVYNGFGWLEHVTDAEGGVHSYVHDGAGKVVADKYTRTKSDGSTTIEAVSYHYDEYSRLTSQSVATRTSGGPNPTYSFGDTTRFKYNIYGDMIGRGINTGENGIIYQESFDYDAGGRLWRTNEGGSSKILFYDKNGNATLTLSSAGADVGALTFEQAKTSIVNASITGDTNIAGAVTTIAVFDKRGQQVATLEPDRELIAGGAHLTIGSARFYNAFGEVVSEIDPRGYMPGADPNAFRTDFIYNRMGRLVEKRSPQVSWTDQNGALANARPTEIYRYDVSGRMIAVVDANGFATRRSLLAGTGHAGTEALVTVQYHADEQNKAQLLYDVFGDVRIQRNEYWQNASSDLTKTDVNMEYDKLGRLTEVEHLGRRLTETFAYDLHGQRIRHTFIHDLTQQFTEYTDYDRQGRIVDHIAVGGDHTLYTYAWNLNQTTTIAGTPVNLGGWVKTTLYEGGRDSTETIDYFDRTVARSDLADTPNTYTYAFDHAGRLASQTVGGETTSYSYLNTSRLGSVSKPGGNSTAYGYDAAGNQTSEVTHRNGVLVQNATATYDAMGRMIGWAEAGTTTLPTASLSIEYDRVGNIRRRRATFQRLNGQGQPITFLPDQDNWYLYDKMNRVTTDRGILVGQNGQGETVTGDAARGMGTIRRRVPGVLPALNFPGEVGADYAYDEAGRRVSMAVTKVTYTGGPLAPTAHFREHKEMYDYFADGSLWQVRNADGAQVQANISTYTVPAATGPGTLRSTFARDALGRVTSQTDWVSAGVSAYSRTGIVYNGKGQITDEVVSTRAVENNQAVTYVTTIQNQYGTGLDYALGTVISSTSTTTRQNAAYSDATTTNTFNWRDGPVMATTRIITNRVEGDDTNYLTTYNYSASGEMTSVVIADGRPRTVFLTNDMAGQIMRRDETGGTSSGQPHDVWYRFGGREMGQVSNNSTLDVDYESSVVYRQIWLGGTSNQGAFRFGATTPTHYADFSQSMEIVNSYEQGSGGGTLAVQAGDTLQSLALQLWGNADLWYKLAEANGLNAASQLIEGQSLTIPIGVVSNAHNASTFKPYDSAKALGDLSPSAPKPPKKPGGCGMLGQLIVAAIAIAVTLIIKLPVAQFFAKAATALGASAAAAGTIGAIAGAAATAGIASAVSQGIGVATGLQEKFSWKGVALSALSAGVGAGLTQLPGGVGAFLAKDTLISNIAQATSAKAVTEGIAVAVGLKKNFDWAGVASAGVAAAVGGIVGRSLPGQAPTDAQHNLIGDPSSANATMSGIAGLIAGAGTRALVTGTSFGDNVASVLPDILTMTIGNAIAYGSAPRLWPQEPAPAAAQPQAAPVAGTDPRFVFDLDLSLSRHRAISLGYSDGELPWGLDLLADLAETSRRIELPQLDLSRLGLGPSDGASVSVAGSSGGQTSIFIPTSLTAGGITRQFGNDPYYRGLQQDFLLEGYPIWFDAYASNGGTNDGTWVRDMLWRELGSSVEAAQQTDNTIGILASLHRRGSTYALPVALSLYERQTALQEQIAAALNPGPLPDIPEWEQEWNRIGGPQNAAQWAIYNAERAAEDANPGSVDRQIARARAENAATQARIDRALRNADWMFGGFLFGPPLAGFAIATAPFTATTGGVITTTFSLDQAAGATRGTVTGNFRSPIAEGINRLTGTGQNGFGYGDGAVIVGALSNLPRLFGSRGSNAALPELQLSRSEMPGITVNIETAIAEGAPDVLARETARRGIASNRRGALRGQARAPSGQSLDEYPFASTRQGGAGARVAAVPVREQAIQGGVMSSFYQRHGIADGDWFRVVIVD